MADMSAGSQADKFAIIAGGAGKDVRRMALDMKGFQDTLKGVAMAQNKVADSAKKMNTNAVTAVAAVASLGQTLKMVGRIADRVADSLRNFFSESIELAIDLREQTNRLYSVFRELDRGETDKFVARIGDAFALSRHEATKLVASVADMGQTLQLTQKSSMKFSGMVIKLSGDLTSLQNRMEGTVDTAESLQAGIFGMTRQLRKMQISTLKTNPRFKELRKAFMEGTEAGNNIDIVLERIRENTNPLAREVEKLGKEYFTTSALSKDAASALAQLAIAYEQSVPAVGDFARTSEHAANSIRAVKSAIVDIKTSVGEFILGELRLADAISVAAKMARGLSEAFQDAGGDTKLLIVGVGLLAAAFATFVSGMVVAIGVALALATAIGAMFAVLGAPVVIAVVVGVIGLFVNLALAISIVAMQLGLVLYMLGDGETAFERIGSGIEKVINGLLTGIGFLWNFWHNLIVLMIGVEMFFEAIGEGIKDVVSNLATGMEAMGKALRGDFKGARATLEGMLSLSDRMSDRLAKIFQLTFKTDIGGITDLKGLLEKLGPLEGLGEAGESDYKPPKAAVEGTVEAANLIAEVAGAKGAGPAERSAKANELTAGNTAEMARGIQRLLDDGVDIANAVSA